MSSSRRSSRLAGWSLRARLLAILMLLLATVCVIIGVATATAARAYLVDQTDRRLNGAHTGIVQDDMRRGNLPIARRNPLRLLAIQGLGPGTLGATVSADLVDARRLPTTPGPPELLPAQALPELADLPADGVPHTRDLSGVGPYRLVATQTPEGDILVTGLPLSDVYDTVSRLVKVEIAVALAALLAAGFGGNAVIRLTLGPLRRVAATAGRVAELPLHAGDVAVAERVPDTDPNTEVGQVGAALNRLLGHVDAALAARQASETRLRQFVADASHELRTPLAAIRGYAELGRRSAAADVPNAPDTADVAQVLARVEAQATRMTALVEDLLLLARLDAGRPLECQQVDVSALIVESIGDAHVAGPDHHWRLEVPEEPVVVAGDSARLHQVLGNLLTNARTHTPAGTTVTVGLSTVDSQALIAVRDNGPGIPGELRPQIFQRFARGDSSRSRAAGSTGLGLSIVDAVVSAHDGSVTVVSRPGETVFTVMIPLLSGPPERRSGVSREDQRPRLEGTWPAQVRHTIELGELPTVEA
jgi:two-component system, OmpR family, sensor kinase